MINRPKNHKVFILYLIEFYTSITNSVLHHNQNFQFKKKEISFQHDLGVEKWKEEKEIHKLNNCNKIKSNKLLKLFCFSNFSINSLSSLTKIVS